MLNINQVAKNLEKAIKNDKAVWSNPLQVTNSYPVINTRDNDYPVSSSNAFVLQNVKAVKGYGSDRWITHADIKAKGLFINKGEKGSFITNTKDGSKICVFNVEQLNIAPEHELISKPIATQSSKKDFNLNAALEDIIKYTGVNIVEDNNNDKSYYDIGKNEIHVSSRNNYASEIGFYTTVMHEIAHFASHKLGREQVTDMNNDDYAKEEITAEITAYMLASENGIAYTSLTNNTAYIKAWLNSLGEQDTSKILSECINNAADNIRVVKTLSEENKMLAERAEDIIMLNVSSVADISELVRLGASFTQDHLPYIDLKKHDKELFTKFISNEVEKTEELSQTLNTDSDVREELSTVNAINENGPNNEDDLASLMNDYDQFSDEKEKENEEELSFYEQYAESNDSEIEAKPELNEAISESLVSEFEEQESQDLSFGVVSDESLVNDLYNKGKAEGRLQDLDFETFTKICDKLILPDDTEDRREGQWQSLDLIEAIASNPVALKQTLENEAPPMVHCGFSENRVIREEFRKNHNFLMLNEANALIKAKNEEVRVQNFGYDKTDLDILYFRKSKTDPKKLEDCSYEGARFTVGSDSPDIPTHITNFLSYYTDERAKYYPVSDEEKAEIVEFLNNVIPDYVKYANIPVEKNYYENSRTESVEVQETFTAEKIEELRKKIDFSDIPELTSMEGFAYPISNAFEEKTLNEALYSDSEVEVQEEKEEKIEVETANNAEKQQQSFAYPIFNAFEEKADIKLKEALYSDSDDVKENDTERDLEHFLRIHDVNVSETEDKYIFSHTYNEVDKGYYTESMHADDFVVKTSDTAQDFKNLMSKMFASFANHISDKINKALETPLENWVKAQVASFKKFYAELKEIYLDESQQKVEDNVNEESNKTDNSRSDTAEQTSTAPAITGSRDNLIDTEVRSDSNRIGNNAERIQSNLEQSNQIESMAGRREDNQSINANGREDSRSSTTRSIAGNRFADTSEHDVARQINEDSRNNISSDIQSDGSGIDIQSDNGINLSSGKSGRTNDLAANDTNNVGSIHTTSDESVAGESNTGNGELDRQDNRGSDQSISRKQGDTRSNTSVETEGDRGAGSLVSGETRGIDQRGNDRSKNVSVGQVVKGQTGLFDQQQSEFGENEISEQRSTDLSTSDRRTERGDVPESHESNSSISTGNRETATSINSSNYGGGVSDVQDNLYPFNKLDKNQLSGERVDYVITNKALGEGTPKEKFANNVAAIKLLKTLENEKRFATSEEQEVLAKYVGWGGLSNAFDPRKQDWANEYKELKELMSENEWKEARNSTLSSFYTQPVVIDNMYNTLQRMGFKSGSILEPACGTGNFLGSMPAELISSVDRSGVEIDSTSGRIASFLYPNSDINICGYEKIGNARKYDVVIGNVPFADIKVKDLNYKDLKVGLKDGASVKVNPSLHNYFFVKSIDKVKSGGVIAFITSTSTMDSKDESIRSYLAQECEFLGAARLPNNAFKKNAGTDVVSDIIFLKKRDVPKYDLSQEKWITSVESNIDSDCRINQYFDENPDMIVGDLKASTNQYGKTLTVELDDISTLNTRLAGTLEKIEGQIETISYDNEIEGEYIQNDTEFDKKDIGTYRFENGELYYVEDANTMSKTDLSAAKIDKVEDFIRLSNAYDKIIDMQMNNCSDEELKKQQDVLKAEYNRFTKNGKTLVNNARSNSFLSVDYRYNKLCALEKLNVDGELEGLSPIFTERTIGGKKAVKIETMNDAVAASIIEKGSLDFDFISGVLNRDKQECFEELQDRIFKLPEESESALYEGWVLKEEYLSGNIRTKLDKAKEVALSDPAYERNVAALESVLPERIPLNKITFGISTSWIDKKIIESFLCEQFGSGIVVSDIRGVSVVNIDSKNRSINGTQNDNINKLFGGKSGKLDTMLNLLVQGRQYIPKSSNKDKENAIPEEVVTARNAALEDFTQAFKKHILSYNNINQSNSVEESYNRKFNCYVNREFSGANLDFEGMNANVKLYPHQRAAVERMLFGGNTLLAHEVGAGKTMEMIAAAMEGKRLGLTNKSLITVPKAVYKQWANEIQRLYPAANVLTLDNVDQINGKQRELMISRIASGNYDIVLTTHEQIKKIPISNATKAAYLVKRIALFEDFIEKNQDNPSLKYVVKHTKKELEKLKEKLERIENQKDSGLPFEKLGIDRLFVDEAHNFKNLPDPTIFGEVKGIGTADSDKANNMMMITDYLNDTYGDTRVVFATGTPISNNITEMHTMMKYVAPETLRNANMESIDSFITSFCNVESDIELEVDGASYKGVTRIKSFNNVPELMRMARDSWDIKTIAELDYIKLPTSHNHVVECPAGPSQKAAMNEIVERVKEIKDGNVERWEDNMLKVSGDGRALGVDARLYDPNLPDENTKLTVVSDNVAKIYKADPNQKDTQLIFCDFGVPNKAKEAEGRFNAYQDIKNKLIERGIPADQIAFIHDYEKDEAKAKLFDQVNKGEIRVLLGSTSKLGTGVNVQRNLKAVHHVDVTWRPSDMEQRNGRIVRQGNVHSDVDIYNYVTEGSFDAFMYQTLRNKSNFTSQILKPISSIGANRNVEIDDKDSLTYEEAMAAATDDPRIAQEMLLSKELKKLETLKTIHEDEYKQAEFKLSKVMGAQFSHQDQNKELIEKAEKHFIDNPASQKFTSSYDSNSNEEKSLEWGEIAKRTCLNAGLGTYQTYFPSLGKLNYRGVVLSIKCVNDTKDKERFEIIGGTHNDNRDRSVMGIDVNFKVNVNKNPKTWFAAIDREIEKEIKILNDEHIKNYERVVSEKQSLERIVQNKDFDRQELLTAKAREYYDLKDCISNYDTEQFKKITRNTELFNLWKNVNHNKYIESVYQENVAENKLKKDIITDDDRAMAVIPMDKKLFLSLPPEQMQKAVANGAKFDKKEQKFYMTQKDKNFNEVKAQQDKIDNQKVVIIPNTEYSERQELKSLGAKWNPNQKVWYVKSEEAKPEAFKKWFEKAESIEKARVYYTTPKVVPLHTFWIKNAHFHEKEELKSLGAKWNPEEKAWYVKTDEAKPAAFKKWIDREAEKEERNNNFALESTEDAISEMVKDMRENGMIINRDNLSFNGSSAHGRCRCDGDHSGQTSGWYSIHLDGCPTLLMQNHKKESTKQTKTYPTKESVAKLRNNNINKAVRKNTVQQIVTTHQNMDNQHELDKQNREKMYEAKSKQLTYEFSNAKQAETKESAYLIAKGVEATKGIYMKNVKDKKYTCIPFFNTEGKITTKQYIDEEGNKRFETGGKKTGSFHVINGFDMLKAATAGIIIAEGYATANTINEATNSKYTVISAGDCGNLETVAKQIRELYPKAKMIIAADNDHMRDENVGLKHATQAAKDVGAMLVYPKFSFGVKASDYNDLKKIAGIDAVKNSLREQLSMQMTNAKQQQQQQQKNNAKRKI